MTNNLMNLATALQWATEELRESPSAKIDARVLLGFALKKDLSYILTWPERELVPNKQHLFEQLVARRLEGEPVAYITGEREFWSLNFWVDPSSLIPRADTEVLVEQALLRLQGSKRVLDLGTGTGAIAIAIASECPELIVTATDLYPDSLDLAERNALRHETLLELCRSSWYQQLENQKFDMIVSNPPYISETDYHLKYGDVRFEPYSALVSPEQGYSHLRKIIEGAPAHLNPEGWLLTEHGFEQHQKVRRFYQARGFIRVGTVRDYSGQPRVTMGQWKIHE